MTHIKRFHRRTESEPIQVGDFSRSGKRYYDQNFEITVVKLFSGECYATKEPGEMLVTILGSCVSACIRDPIAKIGGMNHFLLPESSGVETGNLSEAIRYGAYAMEHLINEILKLGAMRQRLEIKLFGGGNVIQSSSMIGDKNASFARNYLKTEGFKISSEDLGGNYPRRIHYFPDTGKVMVRKLRRTEDMQVVEEERRYSQSLKTNTSYGDVELFS